MITKVKALVNRIVRFASRNGETGVPVGRDALLSASGRSATAGRRLLGASILGAALAVAISGGQVLAGYGPTGGFASGPGSGDGELDTPRRAAIETATGNLFVVDRGNDRVQVFSPDGDSMAYLTQFGAGVLDDPQGIAIREDAGETLVYVTSSTGGGEVVRFESDEQPTPTLSVDGTYNSPAQGAAADQVGSFDSAIALAPNGDLWIADTGSELLKRFDPAGAHVAGSNINGATSPGGAFTQLLDVATSSSGDLYVIDAEAGSDIANGSGTARALRFTPAGAHVATLTPVGPNQRPATVAVAPSGRAFVSGEQDSVYRDGFPNVNVFSPSDAHLQSLDVPAQYSTVGGLAAENDRVFIIHDEGSFSGNPFGTPGVQILAEFPDPIVTLDPVPPPGYTTASVSGSVDPQGADATYRFEYATQADFSDATWASEQGPISGTGAQPVSENLTNLSPGTHYHLRLAAINPGGVAYSATEEFDTQPVAAPVLTIGTPTAVDADSAHITGTVDPGGSDDAFDTSWHFEYATQADFSNASSTPSQGPVEGAGPQPVEADLVDLEPNTLYYVRLVASNLGGSATSPGPDPTFTTDTAPPVVLAGTVQGLSEHEARLTGFVNPRKSQVTDCRFEWSTDTSFSNSIPCTSSGALAGNDPVRVRATISGLTAGTEYHYRLRVTSDAPGTDEDEGLPFTTLDSQPAAPCPNDEFRTGPSAGLPDCRAYEQVSPVAKNGGDVLNYPITSRAAASGDAFSFTSFTGFADVRGSGNAFQYLARRADGDWASHAILPEPPDYYNPGLIGSNGLDLKYFNASFSPELDKGILRSPGAITDEDPNVEKLISNLYLRDDLLTPGPGSYQLQTRCPGCASPFPVATSFDIRAADFMGASSDYSHVLFEQAAPLTSDSVETRISGIDAHSNVYEAIDGQVRAVARVPRYASAQLVTTTEGAPAQDETQQLTIQAVGGEFELVFGPDGANRTAALAFDADAATLQAALEVLPAIGAGDVSVTGGPGDHSGSSPYAITFQGALAGQDVPELTVDPELDSATTCVEPDCVTPAGGSRTGRGPGGSVNHSPNSMSDDGSRIVFSAWKAFGLNSVHTPRDLFLRINGETTIKLNDSERSVDLGDGTRASFLGASTDTTRIVFLSDGILTDSADPLGGYRLYMYDLNAPSGSRLTQLDAPEISAPVGSSVGILGMSDDASSVYFAVQSDPSGKQGRLVEGMPRIPAPGAGTGGADYLYAWHDGDLTYIGAWENVEDSHHYSEEQHNTGFFQGEVSATFGSLWSRVSPDGGELFFSSTTGGGLLDPAPQHAAPSCQGAHEGRCTQFYRYSAASGRLDCVSCIPGVAQQTGHARITQRTETQQLPVTQDTLNSRPMTSDGRYSFFSTTSKLVPEDTNARRDVYEFDSTSGRVNLLSSGKCACDADFLDANADGSDVFIVTAERLVPRDRDDQADVYDVRVGGGLAAQHDVEPPPCVGSDGCQGAGSSPPPGSAPQSDTSGPGNQPKNEAAPGEAKRSKPGKKKRKKHKAKKKKGGPKARLAPASVGAL